jgi:hypothetical protein
MTSRLLLRAPLGAGLVALVATGLSGCRLLPWPRFPAAPPPPPAEVGPGVAADWSLGTRHLVQPLVAGRADPSGPGLRARARLIELPETAALPEPERPAWIFAPGGGEPLEPSPRFTVGAGSGWLAEPLAGADLVVRAQASAPLGGGAALALAPRAAGAREFELLLWIDADGAPSAAVAVAGATSAVAIPKAHAAAVAALDPSLWEARAGVEYAPLAAAAGRPVLWCRVPTTGAGALLLEVELAPAPTRGPAGLAHARELALERAAAAEAARPVAPPTLLGEARERAGQRRALVVELARVGGRALLLDLALLAREERLSTWVAAVPAAVPTGGAATRGPADDAWELERTALADCAREFDADRLDPSLHAVLMVHLGAVGGEPALLGDLVARTTTPQDFAQAVRDEHVALLEDPRSGVRVRALRWLTERGGGPPDFDPLADRNTRRAALDAWRTALEGGTR